MAAINLHPQLSLSFSSSSRSYTRTPECFIMPKPPQNPTRTWNFSYSISTPKIYIQKTCCSSASSSENIPDTKTETQLYPLQEPLSASQTPLEKEEERVQLARETVREYLEEVGASLEDASHISLNCPKYLSMLIDGVLDLDDWNSWAADSARETTRDANSSSSIGGDVHEFKNKVYRLAEGKGDKGILPFLESIGLSLSSATHLARYLSPSSASNALPQLIEKVKYVREIFFSDSDDQGLIGKSARRMMAYLSIAVDDDVQQTLSFFEKVQARRGGLNHLGSEQASLRYLIESFPRLLFLPLESRSKPILKFLGDIGVPKESLSNVLLLFPPILFHDVDKDIKPRLLLYEKVCGHANNIGKMLIKYPWILSTCIVENFNEIIDLLDEEKVPKICSSEAIKSWPLLLGCSVDKLKVMMAQLSEMGISNKKLGQVVAKSPQLLLRKPQEFVQVVSFFRDMGLDEEAIGKTLGRCPEIFAASIDITLKKKLDFLSSVGISKAHLPRVVRKYPELFVCDVDRALYPRIRYLLDIGLSKKEVAFMVRRFSPLLGYSIDEVLRPKIEFLLEIMQKPLTDVIEYPRYFSYSLEKKIKPRYWVLKRRNIDLSLKEMLGKNDEEFAAEYLGVEGEMLAPPS